MASASSSCQGLLEKISPGSPQDLLLEEAVHARIYDENVCPGTSADVLCEPAQSKGTCTSHKSNFVREVTGRMPGPNPGTPRFARACAVEMHMDIAQEPLFMQESTGKMRRRTKCTWTCHKSHFMREFTGTMPPARERTRSNPGLNTYRKNPSMWTDCLGKNCLVDWQGSKNWGSMGHNFPQ